MDKDTQDIDFCNDCGLKVEPGVNDFFIERGTHGLDIQKPSKMVCRDCYENKYLPYDV